jgi:pantetheine-phosphate adenylyltransferase
MSPNRHIAVYTGTFDPIHLGHLDLIERGSKIFDRLVVGVGVNPDKAPLFTPEERVDLIRQVIAPMTNVEVLSFEGLTVDFVQGLGARVMIRGLRTTSDMEAEFTMSLMNSSLNPNIETLFLMAREPHAHLSSSLLKQIARYGGDLGQFLPPIVKAALEAKKQM